MWDVEKVASADWAFIVNRETGDMLMADRAYLIQLYQNNLLTGFEKFAAEAGIVTVRRKVFRGSYHDAAKYASEHPGANPYISAEDGTWVVYCTETFKAQNATVANKQNVNTTNRLNCVVCTIHENGSYMYMKNKGGVTFQIQDAKRFTKKEAENRAMYATRNSPKGYIWKYMQVT